MEGGQSGKIIVNEDRIKPATRGEPLEKRGPSKMFSPGPDRVTGLDLSHQGLRSLSTSLFVLTGIRELQLNNNELDTIPRDIHRMTALERLNLGFNKIRTIPPELGRMIWLRELHLNDNLISMVPMELGSLHCLDVFNLANNPLVPPFSTLSRDRSLVFFCRENNTAYAAPADRAWVDMLHPRGMPRSSIAVGTYNILCNFFASRCTYAPSWVLNADLRKETILQNIVAYNVDILGLQEIETYAYHEFYRDQLALRLDYESAFLPKGRSATLADKRTVDGCATFWRRGKFKLVDQISIDFTAQIASDERFAASHDIQTRHARKDNVALITILSQTDNTLLIVINVHLYWDPEYADVKLLQTILVLEEIEKVKKLHPGVPIVFLGDFNSLRQSAVHNLIVEQKAPGTAFNLYDYSPFAFGYEHTSQFIDAYAGQDLMFTNFTPTFKGVIDYIFYTDDLSLISVLSPVEEEYAERTVGLPNIHFPSDHIFIGARFATSQSKGDDEN